MPTLWAQVWVEAEEDPLQVYYGNLEEHIIQVWLIYQLL